MMVFAVTDLRQGEEVTIEYLTAGEDIDRQSRYRMSFWFECNCPMCLEQARNPSIDERREIWRRIPPLLNRSPTTAAIAGLEQLLQRLEATYHADKYRVNLAPGLSILGNWYFAYSEHMKAILAFQKALSCCTTSSPEAVGRILWYANIMYLAIHSVNDRYVIPAKKAMLDLVRVYAGVPAKVFTEVWVPVLAEYEVTSIFQSVGPLLSIEIEADLRRTREQRRAVWEARPSMADKP
jgi:hypothetical protein